MGVLDFFKSKEITLEECLSSLLKIQYLIEEKMLKQFGEFLKEDESGLIYEVRIFALWVVILSTPSKSIRDDMHTAFCKKVGATESEIESFYKDLQYRYENYFYAFNMLQDGSPSGPLILGGTIFDTIINQNKFLSLSNGELPLTGDTEAFWAMHVFSDAFQLCLGKIKKQGLAEVIKKHI
jgi:hypothetical protein